MFVVDRIAAIIRPRQRMLDWLHEQPQVQAKFSLQNLQSDCTTLLIPVFESPRQAKEYIKQVYDNIFRGELASWGLPEEAWPAPRTYELFNEWFVVEFHSVVLDLQYLEEHGQTSLSETH